MVTTTISPREHDEAEAKLYEELVLAERTLGYKVEQVHFDAGDKRDYRQRSRPWGLDFSVALEKTKPLARAEYEAAAGKARRLAEEIEKMETVYRQHHWNRYFPCRNNDGHIHSSLRGCPTVQATTPMGWYPSLSGKSAGEAVAELGPTLCSVCFPAAPAEWRQKKSDVERGAKQAAKAAKLEAQYGKKLRPAEIFRDGRVCRDGGRGDLVETVAGAKQVLRDLMEFRHYSGPNDHHPWYGPTVAAAEQAKRVLLAREAAKPGTGATQAEIDKILAGAERRQLRCFK